MKKLLGIVVLGLLLSGNAYALKLSNCYYIKTSGDPELISTEFDKTRYEEWYYEIFQDGVQIVKVYTEKELQRLNEKAKEITGVFKFEKISTEQLKITFANDRVIKSSVITFRSERGIETRRRDTIDLKENTITTVAELKIPMKAGWSQDLEYIVKCNRSGSTSSGSDIASSGSGFFINNKGYFVTNYHVIEGCDDKSKIAYRKKEYPAELVASDKKADLAVLKAKVKNKEYLNFSYKPKKLLKVYVAGYPFGKMLSDDLNFHDGIISSLKGFEDNTNQITITAALNPGNSGGPVVNENGEVVGVAVSGLAKDLTEGINFAIKSETVQTFLKSNKIKLSSSFYNKKLDSDDLLELLEEGTVYTFCN